MKMKCRPLGETVACKSLFTSPRSASDLKNEFYRTEPFLNKITGNNPARRECLLWASPCPSPHEAS